jgi:hypothetical protein
LKSQEKTFSFDYFFMNVGLVSSGACAINIFTGTIKKIYKLECLSLSVASTLFAGKARACPSGAQLKISSSIVCKKKSFKG